MTLVERVSFIPIKEKTACACAHLHICSFLSIHLEATMSYTVSLALYHLIPLFSASVLMPFIQLFLSFIFYFFLESWLQTLSSWFYFTQRTKPLPLYLTYFTSNRCYSELSLCCLIPYIVFPRLLSIFLRSLISIALILRVFLLCCVRTSLL